MSVGRVRCGIFNAMELLQEKGRMNNMEKQQAKSIKKSLYLWNKKCGDKLECDCGQLVNKV